MGYSVEENQFQAFAFVHGVDIACLCPLLRFVSEELLSGGRAALWML
jgi:hypothetical protein